MAKPKEQLKQVAKEEHLLAKPSEVNDQELNVFGKAIEELPVIKQLSEVVQKVDDMAHKCKGCSISQTDLNEIGNQLHDIASKLGEMTTTIPLKAQQSVMNVIKKRNNNQEFSDHIEQLDGTNKFFQQVRKYLSDKPSSDT